MGSIASTGIGSGLDVDGIVRQLVQAEGAPKTLRLNAEEAKVQAKLSALGTLRSALASFRSSVEILKDIDKFQGRQVTLSSPDFFSASASPTAVPGTYSIDVDHLAQAQKSQSDPGAYSHVTDVVGTGTLTIAIDDLVIDIAIDTTNHTLAGIAGAINASAAGSKVVATVIGGASEAVLTITGRETGAGHAFSLSQTDGDPGLVSFVAGFDPVQDALDSQAFIDGIEVTSSNNTLTGAITGVDIQLRKANGDDDGTTELTVAYNRNAARKTIDDFVKSYNALVDAIESVSSFDPETRQSGPLFADTGIRNIVFQVRRELGSKAAGLNGSFDTLAELGISADLEGKLSVNAAKLDSAFASDFDAVGELFATDDVGVAHKLDKLLDPYLQLGGIFDKRNDSLKSSIDDIGGRREALNERLLALQTRYLKQFNALDSLLAQMQSTSNFLSQQLSQLPDISLFKKN
jgi:flagellar hook-associated protein 2